MATDECNYDINCKMLTSTEMGRNEGSKQTHIGLTENSFSNLNSGDVLPAYLLFNNSVEQLFMYFHRINNVRSPLIQSGSKTGSRTDKSIVRQIRNITTNSSVPFFLIWFKYEESYIFWLIEKDSEDFNNLAKLGMFKKLSCIHDGSPEYLEIIDYFLCTYYSMISNSFDHEDSDKIKGSTNNSSNQNDGTMNDFCRETIHSIWDLLEYEKSQQNILGYKQVYNKPYDFTVTDSDGSLNFCILGKVKNGSFLINSEFLYFIQSQNCKHIMFYYEDKNGIFHKSIDCFNIIEGLFDVVFKSVGEIYKYKGCCLYSFEIGVPLKFINFKDID